MRGIIYLLTDHTNGKQYVGQTAKTLGRRWSNFKYAASKGSCPISKAIRNHGADHFSIKPLLIVGSRKEMHYYERHCIRIFQTLVPNGYNASLGGPGVEGFKLTRRMREKVRQSKIGKRRPRSVGLAVAKANHLRVWTQEAREKASQRFTKALKERWAL